MLKKPVLIPLLLLSYVGLFYLLMNYAEWAFAPWDTVLINLPEPGTWQRSLNDFFDRGIGSYLFAALSLLPSIGQLVSTLQQKDYLRLILNNLLFLFLLPFALFGTLYIHILLFPIREASYSTAVLPLIAYSALMAMWLSIQTKILEGQEKAKRTDKKIKNDFKRLEDSWEEAAFVEEQPSRDWSENSSI
jgi:hypothetical protein